MSDNKGLEMVNEFLVYGKLNKEDKVFLEPNNVFTQQFDKFTTYPYPDINETIVEIEEIKKFQQMVSSSEPKERFNDLHFIKGCDFNIASVLEEEYSKIGVDFDTLEKPIRNIMSDLGCLVMRLKVLYNRPRAYQVAYYTKQDFNPSATMTGNSPSYPSGHSTQSWFMGLFVSGLYPKKKKKILKLASDIADTRLSLGVHYPSDQKFGKWIAHQLYMMPSIKKVIHSKKYIKL